MPHKRRGVPASTINRHAARIEQVRQSSELYATTPVSDEVAGFTFQEHASLLAMTGRGVGRARLWRAYQLASQKPHEELAIHELQATNTYTELNRAFAMAQTSEMQPQHTVVAQLLKIKDVL